MSHVNIIHETVASAGAIVVVRKIEPNCSTDVAAAPLNPYQPNHRMNTPSAPHEPAKSWKPSFTSQPPGFQIQ